MAPPKWMPPLLLLFLDAASLPKGDTLRARAPYDPHTPSDYPLDAPTMGRDLVLSQYDQVGAEVNGTLDVQKLAGWMAETHANTISFLLWDTDGHQYLDMVRFMDWQVKQSPKNELKIWVTLIPPSESQAVTGKQGEARCSVPADSPLTEFNETSLVDSSKGWKGCNDYVGWGSILGKLAKIYPQLTVLNIDDFTANLNVFDRESLPKIQAGLDKAVKLIPTHYHGGPNSFVWKDNPWLPTLVNGALFYFRNEKGGQSQCGYPGPGQCLPPGSGPNVTDCVRCPSTHAFPYGYNGWGGGFCCPTKSPDGEHCPGSEECCLHPLAGGCESIKRCANNPKNKPMCRPNLNHHVAAVVAPPKHNCTMCCLCGTNAEASVKNLASEYADFAKLLPTGHELHIGMYFSGYSNCLPTSPKYGRDLLLASLALTDPPVTGVTVYTTEVPKGPCPNQADKGCIVQELFGKATTVDE